MANNYGKLDIEGVGRSKNPRRRCFIVTISCLLLVAIVSVGIVVWEKKKKEDDNGDPYKGLKEGAKAIATACNVTTYPNVCTEELSNNSDALTANPCHLVSIAVQIVLDYVDKSYDLAIKLSKEVGSRTEMFAIGDCIELMDNAKDYLKRSQDRLSSLIVVSSKEDLYDVLVWLSTVGSYGDACAGGFDDVPPSEVTLVSHSMRKDLERLYKVTIVAMGLVNSLLELGGDLSSWHNLVPKIHYRRRILSTNGNAVDDDEGFPSWLEGWDDRKLLGPPSPSSVGPDVVVSKDGSGHYKTIQEAVNKIPKKRNKRWVISIKAGVYNEYITLSKEHKNVTFLGDGIGKTIITGNRNVALQGNTTFQSATVALNGEGFIAKGMPFENTASAIAHQAVALRAGADYMVFDACSFEGYQDTLYAHSSRQFYRGCDIYGTVDYIFGNAIAVFQNCRLLARRPLERQKITYTAHGRSDPNDPSGYSFQNCSLVPTYDFTSSPFIIYAYFGRPWKAYSRAVFIGCFLDKHIHSSGWLAWNESNPYINTLYYGEYKNTGLGSNITGRVQWRGVHSAMSSSEASIFSVANFLIPLTWLQSSGVAYDANLLV